MAYPKRRLPGNASGDFYVDETCIDCDTCRWLAPDTFSRVSGQSVVRAQPESPEARRLALLAAVACPTASIGTLAPAPEMPEARGAFPVLITDDVHYCEYHSSKSYGAAPYLIRRPEGNAPGAPLRLPRRLLALMDAADGIDGETRGLPVRMGVAGPRPPVPRGSGSHARPIGKMYFLDAQ